MVQPESESCVRTTSHLSARKCGSSPPCQWTTRLYRWRLESQRHQTVPSEFCTFCLQGRYSFVTLLRCGLDTLLTTGDRTLQFWTPRASQKFAKVAFGWLTSSHLWLYIFCNFMRKYSLYWKSRSQVNIEETSKPTEQFFATFLMNI